MKPSTAPLAGTILACTTIITCYITATSLGHVKYWLPDITHTGLHSPERFFFRVGFLPACLLFTASWYLISIMTSPLKHVSSMNGRELLLDDSLHHINQKMSHSSSVTDSEILLHKIGCWLGQFAGIMLFVGSAVMEEPQETLWNLHIICASGFFLVTFVANILFVKSIWKHPNIISATSVKLKSILIFIQFILIVANVVTTIIQSQEGVKHDKTKFPGGPFIEWLITMSQLCFYLSFVYDLKSLERTFIIDNENLLKRD